MVYLDFCSITYYNNKQHTFFTVNKQLYWTFIPCISEQIFILDFVDCNLCPHFQEKPAQFNLQTPTNYQEATTGVKLKS